MISHVKINDAFYECQKTSSEWKCNTMTNNEIVTLVKDLLSFVFHLYHVDNYEPPQSDEESDEENGESVESNSTSYVPFIG